MKKLFWHLRLLIVRKRFREIRWSFITLKLSDYFGLAKWILFRMIGLSRDDQVVKFETKISQVLGVENVVSFSGGRVAFRAILQAMNVGPGDEVIVPGYTCVVVPYAVIHLGAKPVYVDVGADYLIDIEELKAAINNNTKVIVTQHTYGYQDRVDEIISIARTRGIRVIEDSAHAIGKWPDGSAPGLNSDAAFFSFENSKPLTSFWGGAVATNNPEIANSVNQIKKQTPTHSLLAEILIANHVLLASILYHPNIVGLGRYIFAILLRLGILNHSISESDEKGFEPKNPIRRLSNPQAYLLLRQIDRIGEIESRRRKAVNAYSELFGLENPDIPLLRFPILTRDKQKLVVQFAKQQIELGQWFQAPLHPESSDFDAAGYRWGSCPNAENIAKLCINLPTSISGSDLDHVLKLAERYIKV